MVTLQPFLMIMTLLWLGGKRIQNDRFALLLAHKKFISEDEYYL